MTDVSADRGADPTHLPQVRDYLARLQAAGWSLPPDRLAEMVEDVREHVRDAVAAGGAGGDPALVARNALDRLGPPEEMVRAEAEQSGAPTGYGAPGGQPLAPAPGPGGMVRYGEPIALVLLLFGGFVFVVGWLAGVVLLWLSPSWRLREKLLGSLVWPFGYVGVLVLGGLVTFTESCTSSSSTAVGGNEVVECTGGAPYPAWVGVLILLAVLAAPVVMATLLWRRRAAVLAQRGW